MNAQTFLIGINGLSVGFINLHSRIGSNVLQLYMSVDLTQAHFPRAMEAIF
jgi:hypothetical protein